MTACACSPSLTSLSVPPDRRQALTAASLPPDSMEEDDDATHVTRRRAPPRRRCRRAPEEPAVGGARQDARASAETTDPVAAVVEPACSGSGRLSDIRARRRSQYSDRTARRAARATPAELLIPEEVEV